MTGDFFTYMGKTHYTRKEASQLLNKSGAEIRRMVAEGELSYEHIGGRWVIPARDLEELLEGLPSETLTEGKQDERAVEHQREELSEEADAQHVQLRSVTNAFVSYLNRYITVSPEHEAAFDEFSSRSAPPSGTKLELGTRIEDFVRQCFTLPKPPSIILTGNAGDGKTYLCRQVIETFSGRQVTDWTNHADWYIERNGLTMRVVKDLSETTEDAGAEVLQELALTLRAEEPQSVFLIAANEGRLRSVLERREQLKELNERVDRQLREGPDVDDERLIVFDLNKVTTSAYVPETLRWLTDPIHWKACEGCPAFDGCPIRFNANRLSEEHISDRLALTYRTLEHLDVHATIRDMLIHLAYTVTGGLSCEEVIEQHHDPGHTLHRRVYYENCWGTEAAPANRRKMSVVNHLRHFDVGNYSFFEVDDFIIYGDEAGSEAVRNEHKRLFEFDPLSRTDQS